MPDEANGQASSRLERLEHIVEVMATTMQDIQQEHKFLLRAQVLLTEAQAKTEARMEALAQAQQHTDERLNALIAVVDGIVRDKNPPAAG